MTDIFSKYVMKDEDKSEVFHSSAYGQSQNGSSMGAASTESFETRRNLDHNRQFIRGFNDSKIAASTFSGTPHPTQYVKSEDRFAAGRPAPAQGISGTGSALGSRPALGARPAAAPARQPMQRPPIQRPPMSPGFHR